MMTRILQPPVELEWGGITIHHTSHVATINYNMLKGFMTKYDGYYCVDSYLMDLISYNYCTNNWNAWLRTLEE